MDYNFQANIGADIKEFQSKMKQVDAAIRDAATGADAGIGADIKDFMRGALTVNAELDQLERGDTKVEIDADTSPALRAMAFLRLQLAVLSANNVKIKITAAWNNYKAVMGQIANFSRNIGEVTQIMSRGGLLFLSPAAVPVIASAVGLLGQLGPMLGTILGSTFALATSFGAAGIGAAGFAAVAIPALKGVFDKAGEITDLEMKIADAKAVGDLEKANEHLAEMDRIFKGMSGPQLEAHSALRDFQGTFSQLVKDMEPGVLTAFGGALTGITSIFGLARPMIENVVESVNNLMDSFNSSLEAQDVKDFFSFLGDFAGPALEAIVKAAGNFTMGLFNMMEAFGPLATETQNSFLKMSESFRQWADGLSESEKFQSFVDYVSENMPKIRSIFSDAIQGIINTFAAFAPSSATMMSGLQDLMERFKNFSATLSENQGFQRFVDYVKESGPVVVSTIGSLITFIVNLGIALAPVGSYLLGLVQSFLNWANSMMQAHPWLGKVAAVAFVVVAGLFAIAPAVLLVNAMFGGLIIGAVKLVARLVWATTMIIARFALMSAKAVIHGARVGGAWLLTTGANMIVALARMAASAVVFIAKWALMATQSLLHAARIGAAWLLTTGVNMVIALAKMAASAAIFIAKWALMGVQALLHAAKVAGAWLLTTGASMVTALAKMVATTAIFVAKWVFMGAQALLQAARMAAAWFIALGPVGWVIGIVVGLAILIIANWDKIAAWTSKTWAQIWNWIKEKWASIKSTTSEAVTNVLSTVASNFTQLVSSVREKMENAKNTIRDKWEEAKNTTREKLQSLLSAAKELFAKVVSTISEKMGEAVRKVSEFVGKMPGEVTKFVGAMLSAGSDLVSGLINGIKNMGSSAISAITGVVDGVVSKAKSLLKIKSPSRVFREMGQYVSEGMAIGVNNNAGMAVKNVAAMASGMTNAFNPQLAMADMNASANLDTSISRADMGVVRKSFAAEIDSGEKAEEAIYVTNELVGDKILTHVNRGQAKQSRLTDGFYGK